MTAPDYTELRPCPFCRAEMELVRDHTTENVDSLRHVGGPHDCPIDTVSAFSVGNDRLVDLWNQRTDDTVIADLQAQVEAMREALDKIANAAFNCTHAQMPIAMKAVARAALQPKDQSND